MLFPNGRFSPGHALLAVALLCLGACVAAVFFLARQPWLGLGLAPDGDGVRIVEVAPAGPAAALAGELERAGGAGLRLLSVGGLGLVPHDVIEEPDFIDSYDEMCAMLDRQSRLAALLAADAVRIEVGHPDGRRTVHEVTPAATRPVSDLPPVFWFQLFAGSACLLVGAWVWVLRPTDLATGMFALTGAMFPLSAFSAAVYSSRELAIDGEVFRALSSLNHVGALMFGIALIELFLCYPRRIVRPRYMLLVPLVFLPWLAIDLLQLAPNQNWGVRLPIVAAILMVIVFAWMQWRLTIDDPRARAALTWLSLSVILGCGLFVLSTVASSLFGWLPPLRQGYAFGFFLIMYGGLALGLRRYRLFELDEWAYRILLWVGGAVGLVLLDGLLVLALRLEPFESLGIALVIAGFVYLPARSALWRKVVERRRIPDHELFQSVMEVAFQATEGERVSAWQQLVRRVFDPLELEELPARGEGADAAAAEGGQLPATPDLAPDGLEMRLPAVASSPALLVRYPWQGRELFGTAHMRLARQMVELMRQADAGRAAYERGVAEERRRVARDLHDDLGAQLLTALNRPTLDETRGSIRDAIAEMRGVVAGLTGGRAGLGPLLANLRHETASRLEATGIELDWPLVDDVEEMEIDYRTAKHLASAHREIVSNVIRHSGAARMTVGVAAKAGWLRMMLRDDGGGPCLADAGPQGKVQGQGHGLRNLRMRIEELGGRLSIREGAPGCVVEIDVPVGGQSGRAA
ncbi:sensor histidine kinase [Quisquiliibacterium transsilvanicum]|uniref:Signal transduction histidine kinase n=1 Tax=Quisquiliibacterium transsilvanicum TaxID=1549638 RepID=A0A7W8HIT8_9BURK|nr:ATP-binding protein [Quisquiliibacterium transsilvanicum]MBB5271965.1 signal transduction histidine kinase [Quisquiliibacterium transsilvanicum]